VPPFTPPDVVEPVPWGSWGPQFTRCFPYKETKASVEGYNVSLSRQLHGPEIVLDFNYRSISRDIARGETEGIINQPSIVPGGQVFAHDIRSELPYRLKLLSLDPQTWPCLSSVKPPIIEINQTMLALDMKSTSDTQPYVLHSLLM